MFIKMKESKKGANEGSVVENFEKGKTYKVGVNISEDLAQIFLDEKWAAKVGKKATKETATNPAPETTEATGGKPHSVHRGNGVYDVLDGNGQVIKDGDNLSKDDATALVDLLISG